MNVHTRKLGIDKIRARVEARGGQDTMYGRGAGCTAEAKHWLLGSYCS